MFAFLEPVAQCFIEPTPACVRVCKHWIMYHSWRSFVRKLELEKSEKKHVHAPPVFSPPSPSPASQWRWKTAHYSFRMQTFTVASLLISFPLTQGCDSFCEWDVLMNGIKLRGDTSQDSNCLHRHSACAGIICLLFFFLFKQHMLYECRWKWTFTKPKINCGHTVCLNDRLSRCLVVHVFRIRLNTVLAAVSHQHKGIKYH